MLRQSVLHAAVAWAMTFAVVVLLAALLLVTPALATSSAAGATPPESDPLSVHMDSIDPVVPEKGNIDISGTVTNDSTEQWLRINLHAFSSQSPITDTTSLAASAAIGPNEYVGPRVTEPGTFATVEVLDPGQSADFAMSVPVELLGVAGTEGVYWIGVHALGDSSVPRDEVADGRARTFIPYLPRERDRITTALVLPLRYRVWLEPDGSIAGTDRWRRRLEEGGRLDTTLDIADTAGPNNYTWLVDPAVLSAVRRLSVGNPPRSLDPDTTVPGQGPAVPDGEPTDGGTGPDAMPASTVPDGTPVEELDEPERSLAAAATAWLERFRGAAAAHAVLALPYGDLDVSAAVRHSPARYEQAVARSRQVMTALDIPAQVAVAPEGGVLSPEAIAGTPTDVSLLLGDNAFVVPPSAPRSVVRMLGHKIVVTSAGVQSGGPAPTRPDDPLALRQRLLSEAALRLGSGSSAPVVLTLPTRWGAESAAVFFDSLEQPWLTAVTVPVVQSRTAVGIPSRDLAYTEEDVEAELDAVTFTVADRLTGSATLMEQVLTLQTTVESQVLDEALVTLSGQHRGDSAGAWGSAAAMETDLRDQLASITVEAPRAVTLSSDSGPVGATLVNGLDQSVTVRVDATSDGTLTVRGPTSRSLPSGSRSLIRLEAIATEPGIHDVRIVVTSTEGVPLGATTRVPIRAAQVSGVIWFIMIAAAVLLFGAIAFRLPRQIRARREAARAEAEATEAVADDEPTETEDEAVT